jgi:hypothetical protein
VTQNLLDAFRPGVEIFDEAFDLQLIHRLTILAVEGILTHARPTSINR